MVYAWFLRQVKRLKQILFLKKKSLKQVYARDAVTVSSLGNFEKRSFIDILAS